MPYKVGWRTLPYVDKQRLNRAGTAPRPLLTELWYPAVEAAKETELFLGAPDGAFFKGGRAARDADLLPATFPLILLSHGTGGAAMQLGWLASFLAAQGYLVAGINHHGNNALEPYTAQGFLLAWERAQDVTAVLTYLLDDAWIGPHIQHGQIGAAGFSLGGYTVIALAGGVLDLQLLRAIYADPDRDLLRDLPPEFPEPAALLALLQELLANDTTHKRSYRDERIRAVFAIAPVLGEAFASAGLATIATPVKIVVGEADTMAPAATNAMRFANLIPQAELTILGNQVAHYTFLGEGTALGKQVLPELCLDAPGVERTEIHQQVSQWAKEFFDHHLAMET